MKSIGDRADVLEVLCSAKFSRRSPELRTRGPRNPAAKQLQGTFPDGAEHAYYRRILGPLLNRCADAVVDVQALAAKVVSDVADRGHCDLYRDIAHPFCRSVVDQAMAQAGAAGLLNVNDRAGIASILDSAGISTTAKAIVALFAELEGRQPVSDVDAFIEDVLRVHPPIDKVPRYSLMPQMVAGVELRTDELVAVDLAAANQDDGRHLSFGAGAHHCSGARLARRMLVALATAWQSRIPKFEIGPGIELHWEAQSPQVR